MRKKIGILKALVISALAITVSVPMKANAYIYRSTEYTQYTTATIITDKSNDGSVTYTNRANGKTFTEYGDGTTSGDKDYMLKSGEEASKYMVQVGDNETFKIPMPYNQTLGKLKITKGKGNIAAKICFSNIVTNEKLYIAREKATNKYYYTDYITGEKIYVNNKDADIRVNRAVYKIRIYGKKVGKAKIELPILDINGTKIGKKVFTIDITNNGDDLLSVTFGGKSLRKDLTKMSNYVGSGNSKNALGYVTKKKGKFKVTPNKFYEIKAIYMKKAVGYEKKNYQNPSGGTGSYTTPAQRGVDLNGDGDYNDTIYGIEESPSSNYVYEKIRNGQVVKLSNVPNSLTDNQSSLYRNGTAPNFEYSEKEKSNISTTDFIIIYRDKRDGNYKTALFNINRRISKK